MFAQRRNQVAPIGDRRSNDEWVVVATHDDHGQRASAETANEIVACTAPRAQNQNPSPSHRGATIVASCRYCQGVSIAYTSRMLRLLVAILALLLMGSVALEAQQAPTTDVFGVVPSPKGRLFR